MEQALFVLAIWNLSRELWSCVEGLPWDKAVIETAYSDLHLDNGVCVTVTLESTSHKVLQQQLSRKQTVI